MSPLKNFVDIGHKIVIVSLVGMSMWGKLPAVGCDYLSAVVLRSLNG